MTLNHFWQVASTGNLVVVHEAEQVRLYGFLVGVRVGCFASLVNSRRSIDIQCLDSICNGGLNPTGQGITFWRRCGNSSKHAVLPCGRQARLNWVVKGIYWS